LPRHISHFVTHILALFLAPVAYARVVTFTPSKDNTPYQDPNGLLSNGTGDGLFVGQNADGDFIRRALLAFDLAYTSGQAPRSTASP